MPHEPDPTERPLPQGSAGRRPTGRGYRRERCDGCGLTPQLCICAELPRLQSRVAVDVVVHWREVRKPTNTARLTERMLASCRLLVRGGPHPEAGRSVESDLAVLPPERTLLLYPSEDAEPIESFAGSSDPYRLVVPDGAWSQTQRLARRPALQRFRPVRLATSSSRYALRRGAKPGLLCTLEAIAAALELLDSPTLAADLRRGFDAWQQRALAIRGVLPATDTPPGSSL